MAKLYRYEINYKNYDEDTNIILREYQIIRETQYTYFIAVNFRIKQVRKSSGKFAHTTKKKAKEQFISRTKSRISWYNFWKKECEKALELIEDIKI